MLLDGHQSLSLGTRFEASLASQDVLASVQEFEPMMRIAWGGGPKAHPDSRACHAWIITPTPSGTHLWTEEKMQEPLWLELAKPAPDVFWRTHEKLLEDLAKVAIARRIAREARPERVPATIHVNIDRKIP